MNVPKYAVVVVHGISDKPGDQQFGFSRALAEQIMPDSTIRDKYWKEAVWESVNNALDDKIQDVVLQLINTYEKTIYWRDSELEKACGKMRRASIWIQWGLWKWLASRFYKKITRALDLVLDLPMYLGNPKGQMIRGIVNNAISQALTVTPEGVVLVGHSLGSVIAYDVLQESQSTGGHHFPVKAFITLGSPLAWVTALRISDNEVPDASFCIDGIPWINFFDEQDPVSLKSKLPTSRFPSVQNEPAIRSGEKFIDAHTCYWQREEVANKIAEFII